MSRPYRFIFTSEGAPLKLETHLKNPMNVELCCHQWSPLSMGSWNIGLWNQERIHTTGITPAQKEIADQLSKYFRDSMELQMPHHLVVESKLLQKKHCWFRVFPSCSHILHHEFLSNTGIHLFFSPCQGGVMWRFMENGSIVGTLVTYTQKMGNDKSLI